MPGDYRGALALGHTVVPIIMEVFGGWGPDACKLFRQAARCHRDLLDPVRTSWAARTFSAYHSQRVSVAIHYSAAAEIVTGRRYAGAGIRRGMRQARAQRGGRCRRSFRAAQLRYGALTSHGCRRGHGHAKGIADPRRYGDRSGRGSFGTQDGRVARIRVARPRKSAQGKAWIDAELHSMLCCTRSPRWVPRSRPRRDSNATTHASNRGRRSRQRADCECSSASARQCCTPRQCCTLQRRTDSIQFNF